MAILQAMIQKIGNSIDELRSQTERLNEIPPLNTSTCLICNSNKLVVTKTRKKNKGYSYRLCSCLKCGSQNKQIISTVSAIKNKNIITLSDKKLRRWYKPLTFIVNNNKVKIDKNSHKSFKVWKFIWGKKTEDIYNISEKIIQKDYDNGVFNEIKNSIDPVTIRVSHKLPVDDNVALAKLYFLYMGIKLSTTNILHVYVGTIQYKQLDEENESYRIVFKKAAIIPNED